MKKKNQKLIKNEVIFRFTMIFSACFIILFLAVVLLN